MKFALILVSVLAAGMLLVSAGKETEPVVAKPDPVNQARIVRDLQFRRGLSAYNGGDYVTAKALWERLAAHGDAQAEAGLGFMYHRGFGVVQDHEKAAGFLRQAAVQGQAEGQMMLGSLYFYGQGVPQSFVQSYAWCDLAQDNGNGDAQDCRESSLRYLHSDRDMRAAFQMSQDLHHLYFRGGGRN